jgi:hypothetical protein
MPAQTTNLFFLENLDDASRTRELAETDRNALRAVADWTTSFLVRPHRDLGRAGPVCPFVPLALEHKTLWLAAEWSAGLSAPDVIKLIDGYKRLLLAAQPVDGGDANYKSIVVVSLICRRRRLRTSLVTSCSRLARAVISDWKFFLNNEDWLRLWARRYGESTVEALADELRRLPWRATRG